MMCLVDTAGTMVTSKSPEKEKEKEKEKEEVRARSVSSCHRRRRDRDQSPNPRRRDDSERTQERSPLCHSMSSYDHFLYRNSC